MKLTATNRFAAFDLSASSLSSVVFTLVLALSLPALHATALTWDITSGDAATITTGTGDWNTTDPLNTVWNDGATPNMVWSQISDVIPLNSAIFGGTDAPVDTTYDITLAAQMAASALTFNNTGYKIIGSTLSLAIPGAVGPPVVNPSNGPITVAAGKTATIDSTLRHSLNASATITVNAGSVLNLGGGTTANFQPQLNLAGAGTVNFTAGTYVSTIGTFKAASMNQTGGTLTMSQGTNNLSHFIGRDAIRDQNYTISGGILNVLGSNDATTGYFLRPVG